MNESGVRVFTLPLRGRVGKLGSALARLSEPGWGELRDQKDH
jgi:hypothetical protein